MTDRLLLTEKTLTKHLINGNTLLMEKDEIMVTCNDGVVIYGTRQGTFDKKGRICQEQIRQIYPITMVDADTYHKVNKYFGAELEAATIERLTWTDKHVHLIPVFSELKGSTVRRNSKSWNDFNVEGAIIAWHIEACRSAKKSLIELAGIVSQHSYSYATRDQWHSMKSQAKNVLYDRAKKLSIMLHDSGLNKLMTHSAMNHKVRVWSN